MVALMAHPPLVILSRHDRVCRFAAAELIRHLAASGAEPCSAVAVDPELAGQLPPLAPGAGYRLEAQPLRIAADDGRELLRAVYRHLEELGWRWYLPGPLGEVFRPGVPPARGQGGSPFRHRLVVETAVAKDDPAWEAEARHLIDWLAKQGFTGLALESDRLDQPVYRRLADELARRGLSFEAGGDIAPDLLAATRAGERQALHHRHGSRRARRLEVADREALANLPEATRAAFAALQPAAALRLREPADAPLTLHEPGLIEERGARWTSLAKAVAEGLGAPQRLALWQPLSNVRRGFTPPDGARLIRAIDRRSLAVPLGDATGTRSVAMLRDLRALLESGVTLEVAVPYADLVALRNLHAPMTGLIVQDLRALAEAGIERLALTVQGLASTWACGLNAYVFARVADDPGLEPSPLVEDWCAGLYGSAADEMIDYLHALEATMRHLWRLRNARYDSGIRSWRAGEPAGLKLMETIDQAVDELAGLRRQVAGAAQAADDERARARLRIELIAFDLNHLHVRLWQLRMLALAGHPTLAVHAAARDIVGQARRRLNDLPAAAGVAWRAEHAAILAELASWCGYETAEEPVDGALAVDSIDAGW